MNQNTQKRIWRLSWFAVLLLHIPAVLRLINLASEGQLVSIGACLMLGASILLFALELAYCPVFAVCSNRRRLIALLLIIAIMHVGFVEQPAYLTWITSVAAAAVALWYACSRDRVDPRRYSPRLNPVMEFYRQVLRPRSPVAFWSAHPALAPPPRRSAR